MKSYLSNYKWVYAFIIIFSLVPREAWRNWLNADYPFQHDVDQYYSYCVAAWVKNDLSFKSITSHAYWLVDMHNGYSIQRFTYGMALMYTPFFLLAHFFSQIIGLSSNGYTAVYGFFISCGTLFYVLTGFIFLRKALLKFYSEKITASVIFSLFLCTNLFYYTMAHGELSHSYLFSIFSFYIYMVIQWHEQNKTKYLYAAMFAVGLATLIRPIEIFSILFLIFYSVYNKETLQQKLHLLGENRLSLLKSLFFVVLPIFPQLLYWKIYGGQWLIYTYGKEGFFFSDPKILYVLFSYRNGVLIYSPIIIFSIIGFFFLYKKNPKMFWGSLLFFLIILYIVSCWWTWWFGGGFGYRAIIETFAFLAFPMAAFYDYFMNLVSKRKVSLIVHSILISLMVFCFANNIIRHYQYKTNIIQWDSMSKEAFWYSGWRLGFNPDERNHLESLYVHPNYEEAIIGIRDLTNENITAKNNREHPLAKRIKLKASNGKYVCVDGGMNSILIANRDTAQSWETFSLILLEDSKCAIQAYNNRFCCAELGGNNEITATREKMGSWETFSLITFGDTVIAFKAANSKFLSVDNISLQIFAKSDSISWQEKFEMIDQ